MEMRSTYDTRKIEIHCRRMGQNIAAEPKPVQLQNLIKTGTKKKTEQLEIQLRSMWRMHNNNKAYSYIIILLSSIFITLLFIANDPGWEKQASLRII